MRFAQSIALLTTAFVPSALPAQSNDLGRSLSQIVDTVVTTGKQRKVRLQLGAPFTYESAAGPIDPAKLTDPRNLDVAGVRLNMTVKEAQTALRAAGYVDAGPRDDQPSYANEVVARWSTDFGYQGGWNDRSPRELLWNKGEEEIRVALIALPDGPRVNGVTYRAKEDARISQDEFIRRVLAKYGEPVNENPADFRWCTVKAPNCERLEEAEDPLLVVYPAGRVIELSGNDPGRKEALAKRFAADVELRRTPERAPSF